MTGGESLDLRKKLLHIMDTRMKYSIKQGLLKAIGEEYGLDEEEVRHEMLEIRKND